MRRIIGGVTLLALLATALPVVGPVDAADALRPHALAVRFASPTPPAGATVTTNAATVAFSYNRTPGQTRRIKCTLSGPTSSTKRCSAPVRAGAHRSRSRIRYTGLADGAYTFRVVVRLNNGARDRATRRFTVATPQRLHPLHADYWENSSGRYLNVEAFSSKGSASGGSYVGPRLMASWRSATGVVLGSGAMTPFIDAATYVRHRTKFRLGSVGSGGMPASVRIASSDGQTTTVAVKSWITAPPRPPVSFVQGFNTHYTDPIEQREQLDALTSAFANVVEGINMPARTSGYQRRAQAIVGVSTGPGELPPAGEQAHAVVVTSRAQGHDGGNQILVRLVHPPFASSPLSVATSGNQIVVGLGTDAAGSLISTATQVVDALNAQPSFAAMATASTFRGSAGAGIPLPTAGFIQLSDFLKAPASVPRGPFEQRLYRIGAHRDGSRLGVLVYCQESGREWVTPLVCSETAERLVRNYGTDPETTALLNDLDIFIVPSVNPDAALYSMYDASGQSKTLSACTESNDPAARNTWGVALTRNFSIGSLFDGYAGASSSCDAASYAGPSENSEPEARNLEWVLSTFPNIRFAANVSTGGSVTWAPGAYRVPDRVTLPSPSPGTEGFLRQTARRIAGGVSASRGTTIGADRAAAGVDVQGSEAGNSTDMEWYEHGIFAFDLGTGVPRFTGTSSAATIATGVQPCFGGIGTGGGQGACPVDGRLVNEGYLESMEFADGAYALFRAASAYADDITAPTVATTVQRRTGTRTARVTFTADDATDVYYTTDGSNPTLASRRWAAPAPGAARPPLAITRTTTIKWIAVDAKGNVGRVGTRLVTV